MDATIDVTIDEGLRARLDEAPTVAGLALRPPARPASLGDVVADKYRLVRILGVGGMGRIFEADHLLLDSKVALKFMHPHLASDPAYVERFEREARAAATLQSPHAARVFDVDQLPSGELYIVMEYLEGASLETMVKRGRGLPIADAVTFVAQACHALAEAHDRGIVHRDVKPANLFLTVEKSGAPRIKVLDFGLAKSGGAEREARDGKALGTPQYMSPEQIRGAGDVDPRADVWSLGATLYELLTGYRAFDGPTPISVFAAVLERRCLPVRSVRAAVPASLASIVHRCLAHDPAARFASVRELARALEDVQATLRAAPAADADVVAPHPSTPSGTAASEACGPVATQRLPAWSVSRPPASWSQTGVDRADRGSKLQRTAMAAMAGPALVAIAAAVMAVVVGTGAPARAATASAGAAAGVSPAAVQIASARD